MHTCTQRLKAGLPLAHKPSEASPHFISEPAKIRPSTRCIHDVVKEKTHVVRDIPEHDAGAGAAAPR